jgi:hypothetical protein
MMTFHNLRAGGNREAASNFRMVHLDPYNTLVLAFHKGEIYSRLTLSLQ